LTPRAYNYIPIVFKYALPCPDLKNFSRFSASFLDL